MLENKLGAKTQAELNNLEEKISKMRAKELFESGKLEGIEVGTFKGLADIHFHLFSDIYEIAGKVREVNIAKDSFQFAPRMFLKQSLDYIDKLPHNDFDQIIDKYNDMNVAHPFREGNGRSMRIWLDNMLRSKLGKVIDWNSIDREEYLNAMKRSTVSTGELKYLLLKALTTDLSKETYFKGIDVSYYYEGYNEYKTEEV